MEIIKQGKVIFEKGKIIQISDFHIKGNVDNLINYVVEHYTFKKSKGDK